MRRHDRDRRGPATSQTHRCRRCCSSTRASAPTTSRCARSTAACGARRRGRSTPSARARVGLGLLELGVEPGDRIAIHSENRPEWVLADLGAQGIGAIVTGIYPTSPAAEVEYLLGHSESVVLVAEDEEQLDKALAVREQLPALQQDRARSTRATCAALDDPMVMTFERARGARRASASARSGTSASRARPRRHGDHRLHVGHDRPAEGRDDQPREPRWPRPTSFLEVYDVGPNDEVLSYLPLCHIAERLFSVIDALGAGYVVNFGEGGESFTQDLRDVQPTFFLGVPRVWEKMMAAVEIRMADASWLKRAAAPRGPREAAAAREARDEPLPHRAVGRRADRAAGARVLPAPRRADPRGLRPDREHRGLHVHAAPTTCASGRSARRRPASRCRIAEDGEILTRSAGVFQGYFKNPEATRETVDADGWLHTGDVGELDDDGFLTITDRKKDIIITAGGKNISPSEIENKLKVSPYVREAVVIGDRRKYLVALIGIESDTVGDWALAARPAVHDVRRPRRQARGARADRRASSSRSTASSRRSRRSRGSR